MMLNERNEVHTKKRNYLIAFTECLKQATLIHGVEVRRVVPFGEEGGGVMLGCFLVTWCHLLASLCDNPPTGIFKICPLFGILFLKKLKKKKA